MREQAIEAMARAYYRKYEEPNKFPYTEDDEAWRAFWTGTNWDAAAQDVEAFGAAFDALLDYLEQRTADWMLTTHPLAAGEVYALIAVLR